MPKAAKTTRAWRVGNSEAFFIHSSVSGQNFAPVDGCAETGDGTLGSRYERVMIVPVRCKSATSHPSIRIVRSGAAYVFRIEELLRMRLLDPVMAVQLKVRPSETPKPLMLDLFSYLSTNLDFFLHFCSLIGCQFGGIVSLL